MENYSLSRKYRPQKLSDLVGQNTLSRTIKNSILTNKLSSAFILQGIHGVGKTTTARIIAKCINCTNIHENADPCNECENCKMISNFSHPDVLEIDAATNTGVEDIRNIKETAHYVPSIGKAKVYIVDEAHMLSNSAFNALLKIIEEPPLNVYWIFTTTEIKKIPLTIVSRCQNFALKKINNEIISEQLKKIAQNEDYTIEDGAIKLIAQNANGSMRDAISLFEQITIYSIDKKILEKEALEVFGIPQIDDIIELIDLITSSKINESLEKLKKIISNNTDCMTVFGELLKITNKLMHAKINPQNQIIAEHEKLLKIAEKLHIPSIDRIWQIIFNGMRDLEFSNNTITAEAIIIRLGYINKIPIYIEQNTQNQKNNKPLIGSIEQSINPKENYKTIPAENKKNTMNQATNENTNQCIEEIKELNNKIQINTKDKENDTIKKFEKFFTITEKIIS